MQLELTQPDGAASFPSPMVSLSVLFEQGVGEARVVEALRAAGLGDQRMFQGGEGRLTVDGREARVSIGEVPLGGKYLAEAIAHAGWAEAAEAVSGHRAWVRVVILDGRRDLARLGAAGRVARALLDLPGAIALLDEPAGALHAAAHASARLGDLSGPVPPLELWIAVRRFVVADARGVFLDTLGMEQLGVPDLETYAGEGAAAEAVTAWLRNLALYLAQQGEPIRSGDTLDGPDEQPWVAREDEATVEPSRRVVRFSPV